jgi:hypothetical protein
MTFRSRVVAIPIVTKHRMFSSSTSTYTIENLEDLEELKELLPHAESMQLHWLLDDVATNEIDWNIDAFVGWDRDHEITPAKSMLTTDATASGPGLAVTAGIVAATDYMRHCRLQLKWRLHAGVNTLKEAMISIILYVTTKGQ